MAATVELVIGAPAWDRAWSLPLWFESVRANVDPANTGLVFVVPPTDTGTREVIAALSAGFSWVEVIRDRGKQSPREERPATRHETLAQARNQILRVVTSVRPQHYLSWDTDFLIPEGVLPEIQRLNLPLTTVWAWLNRQPPKKVNHFDGERYHEILWQPPVCATAMAFDRNGQPIHYPSHEYALRARGLWECGVTLAWQLMGHRAYSVASYRPHAAGEDVSFALELQQRGIPRFCYGEVQGVHLYDRTCKDERELGWPDVMKLAQQYPLAAHWTEPRSALHQAIGFYPTERTAA